MAANSLSFGSVALSWAQGRIADFRETAFSGLVVEALVRVIGGVGGQRHRARQNQ